jgi:hypothetical protein
MRRDVEQYDGIGGYASLNFSIIEFVMLAPGTSTRPTIQGCIVFTVWLRDQDVYVKVWDRIAVRATLASRKSLSARPRAPVPLYLPRCLAGG